MTARTVTGQHAAPFTSLTASSARRGQRRRRYRDERYPTQSAMPLETAAASPEMASGKVWITYPVTQTHEHFTSNRR